MLMNLSYMLLLISGGFILSRILLSFCRQIPDALPEYKFRTDPWIYLLCLTAAGLGLLYYFLPDFTDVVVAFPMQNLLIILTLGALIYLAFLLELEKTFYMVILIACTIIVLLMPDNGLIFEGFLPLWLDRILGVAICFVITTGMRLLNQMYGIFAWQCLTISFGLFLIALIGGVPLYLGFFGAWLSGLWLGFLNLNWYPGQVYLNRGACTSASFIFAALLLQGSAELAESSMLILLMYFVTECLWILKHALVFGVKTDKLFENTIYMTAFKNGLNIPAIGVSIVKICTINILLAAFQLYAPNPYSIPLFAFVVNLWLVNILYNVSQGETPLTIKETNQKIIGDIRGGLRQLNKNGKKTKKKK